MRRVLLALVVCPLLAACGGGDGPREEVVEAAQRTADASGLRAEIVGTIRGGPFPGPLQLSAQAVMAGAGERVRGSFVIEVPPGTPDADELAAFSSSQLIEIGTDSWFRYPQAGDLLQEGVEWILADAATQEEIGLNLAPGGLGAGNPTDVLDGLGERVAAIEEAGNEEVRGIQTTRYRTTVEFTSEDAQAQGLAADVPTEIWVGDDGLVRRFSQTLKPRGVTAEYTIEYFDFGIRPDVQPPPDEITTPFEEAFAAPGG